MYASKIDSKMVTRPAKKAKKEKREQEAGSQTRRVGAAAVAASSSSSSPRSTSTGSAATARTGKNAGATVLRPTSTRNTSTTSTTADRTVLVPVAAEGSDAYTVSCITDILTRFGAQVVVAKVECCVLVSDTSSNTGSQVDGGNNGEGDTQSASAASSCSMWDLEHGHAIRGTSRSAGSPPRQHRPSGSSPTRRSNPAVAFADDMVCTASSGVRIVADTSIKGAAQRDWDMIVLPGGMPGCKHLRSSEVLMNMIKYQRSSLKLYGAIGEAPSIVLASGGLLCLANGGRGATCFPDPMLRSDLTDPVDTADGVVVQGNLTTAVGPGAAMQFALKLGEHLYGVTKAETISREILFMPVQNNNERESRDRKRSASTINISKWGESSLGEENTFMNIVWPVLDSMGWTIERKPTGRAKIYCQPGVTRDSRGFAVQGGEGCGGSNGNDSEGTKHSPSFETRQEIIDYIIHEMSSNSLVQNAVRLYSQCLERADDLIEMGSIDHVSLEAVIAEVRMNSCIAEVPLFDEIIWPQLVQLGWTVEEETRIRPRSYVPPHIGPTKGPDRFKDDFAAPNRKRVVNFLLRDDVWGSMDEVLRVLEVYHACISVGNDMSEQGILLNDCTPLWLYLKARERRPALSWLNLLLGPDEKKEAEKAQEDQQHTTNVPELVVAAEGRVVVDTSDTGAEPKNMNVNADVCVSATTAAAAAAEPESIDVESTTSLSATDAAAPSLETRDIGAPVPTEPAISVAQSMVVETEEMGVNSSGTVDAAGVLPVVNNEAKLDTNPTGMVENNAPSDNPKHEVMTEQKNCKQTCGG